jgi:hypothetical protein
MRRVLIWIVVFVALIISVISAVDLWSRLELARGECKQSPMPDRDLNACIREKWLFRRAGETRQHDG